ncbi:MAG: hypothetical protein QGF81_06265 [Dehalococcoidia bacterium]|nr:hypothetical protein [Dehalococcoidia bacterium]
MNGYLDEARTLYEEALVAFERGRRSENPKVIREAAEKAWGSMVQATNSLIEKRRLPVPRTPADRRARLADLERLDRRFKQMGFRDRFGAREHFLHEDCYFDGICPVDLLEEDIFSKVRAYIEDAASYVNQGGPR